MPPGSMAAIPPRCTAHFPSTSPDPPIAAHRSNPSARREWILPCCRPKVAPGMGGAVYVTWRKVFQGNIRDMVVSASKDAGETFAPPVRIAEDNWKINGCPESGATALVVGRRLYVAWMTEATPQQAGVKLAWSDDGAKSFAPPVLVSKGLLDANHPVLSASGDSDPVLVFQARDADAAELESAEPLSGRNRCNRQGIATGKNTGGCLGLLSDGCFGQCRPGLLRVESERKRRHQDIFLPWQKEFLGVCGGDRDAFR